MFSEAVTLPEYKSSIFAETNLMAENNTDLQFYRSKVQHGSYRAKSQGMQGWVPSGSRGKSIDISLPLPVSRCHLHSSYPLLASSQSATAN